MDVIRYQPVFKTEWDAFVEASKNGTFLFKRDYMEYHSERFIDISLLFYKGRRLVALLPASLHGKQIVSHGGLTYGGIIMDSYMTVHLMQEVFASLISYLKAEGLETFSYKRVPSIYYAYPSDEDLYALFCHDAELSKRGFSSAIYLPDRIKYGERRRRAIKKAERAGLQFVESFDYASFIDILSDVLLKRHHVVPVHTADELKLLASRFPDNIKLYLALKDERMLAGTIIYETPFVAHSQYLVNSEEGRDCGALDFVIDRLISERYSGFRYFDFGISTENGGRYLNEGLAEQKQEFGGRGVVYLIHL